MAAVVAPVGPTFTFAGGTLVVPVSLAVNLVLAFPQEALDRYDFASASGWNTIDGSDIGRLNASGMVGFNMAVAAALLTAGTYAPWHGVPVDARLEDALFGSALEGAGVVLYEQFKLVSGVGDAIASKLLHLKRPAFFPILDSAVQALYLTEARKLAGTNYPLVRHYWQAIRNDLIGLGQSTALETLRAALTAHPDPPVRARATLSALRLRDILIWMSGPGAALGSGPQPGQTSSSPLLDN